MSLCKLEFFDNNFKYVHHALAEIEELDDDYLSPEKTEIMIDKTDLVKTNQFVYITGEFTFFGIVTKVGVEDDQTEVTVEPFISLFDGDALVETSWGGDSDDVHYLEELIAQSIFVFWGQTYGDYYEGDQTAHTYITAPRGRDDTRDCRFVFPLTIPTLQLNTSSIMPYRPARITWPPPISEYGYLTPMVAFRFANDGERFSVTKNFTMELSSDDEFSKNRMKVNLRDDILYNAIKYYGVVVEAVPDFANRWIDVRVSTPSGYPLAAFEQTDHADYTAAIGTIPVISADDQTVTIESFSLDSSSSDVNTLVIYSTNNTTLTTTYYLHNDGRTPAYSTANDNARILPAKYGLAGTSGSGSTFTTNAEKKAKEFFKNLIWNSSIELKFTKNDPLFQPEKIKIGQLCHIWHDGKCYTSMLTGRKLGDETTLMFGSVRTTLTKQMKLEKKKKKN